MSNDMSGFPAPTGAAEVTYLYGSSPASGSGWITYTRPRGKTMLNIVLVGKGGNGGTGAIGANSTAAGGGGGGSGGQTILTMPWALLPDVLYFSLAGVGTTSAVNSFVAIRPLITGIGAPYFWDTLMYAAGGANGGNAAGATAGAAGAAGGASSGNFAAVGHGFSIALAGQAGVIGGVAVAGTNQSPPGTGLIVMGGCGGGGLPAAAAAGTSGGTVFSAGLIGSAQGGVGSATATNPAARGEDGKRWGNMAFGLGGAGGASTHGTAVGAGLVQSSGGNGAPGCGGGGTGGALTGSAAGIVGLGGCAFAIITTW